MSARVIASWLVCRAPWVYVHGDATVLPDTILHSALSVTLPAPNPALPPQRVSLYQARKRRFPIGLLARTIHALTACGIPHEVQWDAVPPLHPNREPFADGRTLRPYQVEALDACETYRRGTLWAATGYGKTLVDAGLARDYPDARVLVLIHRRDPHEQTIDVLETCLGEKVGRVAGPTWDVRRVTVAMIQTLASNMRDDYGQMRWDSEAVKLLASTDVLIAEEAHTISAPSHAHCAALCPAPMRIGMTGSPFHDEDPLRAFRLEAACGPVIYKFVSSDMADAGLLAKAHVWMVNWGGDRNSNWDDWPECYDSGVVFQNRRNVVACQIARRSIEAGRVTLVIFHRQPHGPVLQDLLGRMGLHVPRIDGTNGMTERKDVWDRLRRRELLGAVVSLVVKEGLDIPSVQTIVLASGRKSNIELIQTLGRGLRLKAGIEDQTLDLVDFWDQNHSVLRRHSKRRLTIWRREGHQVTIGLPPWIGQ